MELGIVLAVCIFVFTIIIYLIKSFYKDEITSLKRLSRQDQQSIYNSHFTYLRILRREYANNILNPETLLSLDRKAYVYEKKVEKMSALDFNIEIASFWKKYPDIADFDVINDCPHYIKYKDDSMSDFISMDECDKSESYLNIVKYMALLDRERSGFGQLPPIDIDTGTDIEHLKETQRTYDNQRLEKLGIEAVKRRLESGGGVRSAYEDNEYDMHPLPITNPADYTWIHIKNTDEYVVHEFFISDDGEEFNHINLSNAKQEVLNWLGY
jgi:hypothetical protein